MTDVMWTHISEGIPDGCCDLEVMYLGGSVESMCSCDLHWMKYQGKEMPEWLRLGSMKGWEEYL